MIRTMLKLTIPSLLLAVTLHAAGQAGSDCEPVVISRLDSVVSYVWEGQTSVFIPSDVYIYGKDQVEQNRVIERLSLPSRAKVNIQRYYDDANGNTSQYVLQVWNGTAYVNSSRTDYSYNPEGYLSREVFSRYEGNAWVSYQQHLYNYDEDMTVMTYLRQMMYSPGVWTDFSYKNYLYDEQGRLIERNEQRISDGVIFWAEQFTYDENNRVSVRVRQGQKYDPVTRTYPLVNLNRQIYSYDRFGDLSEYLIENYTSGSWVLAGKSTYFRSFLLDKLVPICYRGQTLTVTVRVALRLLNYGAMLGTCECLYPDGIPDGAKSGGSGRKSAESGLTVYPNPARTEITAVLPEEGTGYGEMSIYSQSGSLMQRTGYRSLTETIDISGLRPGSYYLVVTVDGESFSTTFVKKQ